MVGKTPFQDDVLFVPAGNTHEAAARLFSLTGATDPGTRGPKRALEALATNTGLDVDLAATNAVLGAQIAHALGATWEPGRDTHDMRVSLAGLNTLLRVATQTLWETSQQTSVPESSYADVLRSFPAFAPARDKQEAIDRISDLAEVERDTLGPGGKEHRITFEATAARVAPHLLAQRDATRSKHSLFTALCEELAVPWLHTAASTGQSITLEGLNLLLAGAERHLGIATAGRHISRVEGALLLDILSGQLPEHWDGRSTVLEMEASDSRNWRQTEWAGFYFEEQVSALLSAAFPTPLFGGPRRVYGATTFDYASPTRVWDAKAHTATKIWHPSGLVQRHSAGSTILNDVAAITACVHEQGLGFLILEGASTFDETGLFDQWHRAYTRKNVTPAKSHSNTGKRRARKMAFTPIHIRALWIENAEQLDAGIAGGWLTQRTQGAQAAKLGRDRGAKRNDKFHLRINCANPWVIAQTLWPQNGTERC